MVVMFVTSLWLRYSRERWAGLPLPPGFIVVPSHLSTLAIIIAATGGIFLTLVFRTIGIIAWRGITAGQTIRWRTAVRFRLAYVITVTVVVFDHIMAAGRCRFAVYRGIAPGPRITDTVITQTTRTRRPRTGATAPIRAFRPIANCAMKDCPIAAEISYIKITFFVVIQIRFCNITPDASMTITDKAGSGLRHGSVVPPKPTGQG
jgi:hypothetical protein